MQTADMPNKGIAQNGPQRIPADASLQDIAYELEFIAAIRQGVAESFREIIVRTYRIVYRVGHRNQLIEIIRFWHTRRTTPHLPETEV